MGARCLQFFLVLLHLLIALASGFFSLFTEFYKDDSLTTCLPNLLDDWDHTVTFKNGLPVICNTLVYGMGAICLLNFIMCAVNNCLLQNPCVAYLNTVMTSVYLAYSVMSSSVVTVYYMVWCDVLQQIVAGSDGCQDAATRYDGNITTSHMSSNKFRMEVQMASTWALFPLILFTLLAYLPILTAQTDSEREGQFKYIIIKDETTPLMMHVNSSPNATRNPRAAGSSQPAYTRPTLQATSSVDD